MIIIDEYTRACYRGYLSGEGQWYLSYVLLTDSYGVPGWKKPPKVLMGDQSPEFSSGSTAFIMSVVTFSSYTLLFPCDI